jgi:hypothetical protein
MTRRAFRRLHWWATLSAIALVTAACSTTQVDATWHNEQYAGRRITGPVLVVALSRDETLRRRYEDEMQAQLAAHGVQSVRSYEAVGKPLAPDDAPALVDTARRAGATRIIWSASTRTDAPGKVTAEIRGFVAAVVGALDRAGLL